MLVYRTAPEGFLAAGESPDSLRYLFSDPFATPLADWRWGHQLSRDDLRPLAPVLPGKIVGVGRNYRDHAAELGNPMPEEPLLFLKAPSSVIGPNAPVVLPRASAEVHFEGEIALVVGRRLYRPADEIEARGAIAGVTCACDVTARDLQNKDRTFTRGKSFDTFCPIGPALALTRDLESLQVITRVNGAERQRGTVVDMAWSPAELMLAIASIMTLEPGDLVLSGTPAGVGPLADGDVVEVEIPSVGVLSNPVEAQRD